METKTRFSSALWAKKQKRIFIGGAGGIGSWTAFLLARTNEHELYICDPDRVSEVNLAGQMFGEQDINKFKIEALEANINNLNYPPVTMFTISRPVEEIEGLESFDYIISGFDNMTARQHLFAQWKKNPNRQLYIDARLLGEQFEVYYVQKGMEDKYEATLFDQSEAEEASCTFKSTTHWAVTCAAKIVHGFNAFISNKENDGFYELPFKHLELGASWQTEIEL